MQLQSFYLIILRVIELYLLLCSLVYLCNLNVFYLLSRGSFKRGKNIKLIAVDQSLIICDLGYE